MVIARYVFLVTKLSFQREKSKTKMDELKNEKENYKENSVINRKQTVNFRKGAFGEGVNT